MNNVDQALALADRKLAQKRSEEFVTQLSTAVTSALSPEIGKLVAALGERMDANSVTLQTLAQRAPEKVALADSIRIDDTVNIVGEVHDPQIAQLSEYMRVIADRYIETAPEPEQSSLLDDVESLVRRLMEQELKIGLYTSASPSTFLPVRLTDGKTFYKAGDVTVLGGGSSTSGSTSSKPTDAYRYSAESITATYEYAFYEDESGNWYIERETLASGYVHFTAGSGGVASVYVNDTSDPSGAPTWGTYAETF